MFEHVCVDYPSSLSNETTLHYEAYMTSPIHDVLTNGSSADRNIRRPGNEPLPKFCVKSFLGSCCVCSCTSCNYSAVDVKASHQVRKIRRSLSSNTYFKDANIEKQEKWGFNVRRRRNYLELPQLESSHFPEILFLTGSRSYRQWKLCIPYEMVPEKLQFNLQKGLDL